MHAMLLFREQNRITAFRIEGLKDQCQKKSYFIEERQHGEKKTYPRDLDCSFRFATNLLCEPEKVS